VIDTLACPMYADSAFALTPAAIIRDANVCLASWRPIGSSPAAFHAAMALRRTVLGSKGASEADLAQLTAELERAEARSKAIRGELRLRELDEERAHEEAFVASVESIGVAFAD
jgi:hypothetical protein